MVLLPLLLSSCAVWYLVFPPPATEVTLSTQGAIGMNKNTRGEDNAVTIRIYKLGSREDFDTKDFSEIWSNEGSLQGQIGSSRQIVVVPNSREEKTAVPFDGSTKFIGLIGLFNQPNEDDQKVVLDLAQKTEWRIQIEGYRITLEN